MKNKRIVFVMAVICCLVLFCPALAQEKLNIVTTVFPCYDTARVLAGENGQVTMLLPPGSESHQYEPSPMDIARICEADLFVYVGGESDTWVEGILDSFGEDAPRSLSLAECVSLREEELSPGMAEEAEGEAGAEMDEHVWTSPVNMMDISQRLTGVLCELAPEKREAFEAGLESYLAELQRLDEAFRNTVAEGKRNTIVFGDRFPFLYFVKEYGLNYDAAFPGCSEDTEPSANTVITLIDKILQEKIPVVFYIEFSSRRTADIIAEETGTKELLFHSCHNVSNEDIANGVSYISLMWQNVDALKEALQ